MPLRTSILPRHDKKSTCQGLHTLGRLERDGRPGLSLEECNASRWTEGGTTEGNGAQSASLGNNGKSASPYGKQKEKEKKRRERNKEANRRREAVIVRFALQNGAKHLLRHNKALQGCCAWLQHGQEGVSLISYPTLKKARFGGLQTCASVWACPICAAKISERRRVQDLVPALAAAKEKGLSVLLITYTLRHEKQDRLSSLLRGMKVARKRSRSGKRWNELKRKYNIVGSVRAFEITHGDNGWHPHFHELLFIDGSYDRAALVADLRRQWDDGIRLAGLREVTERGVDVSDTYARIEEYVTKWGHDPKWGAAEEMAKQPVKKARSEKGRAPFQLLSDFTFDGDLRAGALFREYADAMKGERQLYWSPKLKSLLGVRDLSDKQIEAAEERDKLAVNMDFLLDAEYRCICADDRRGDLWCVVADGDKVALDAFLAPYRSTRVNKPVAIKVSVQLVDRSADERDRLVPVADPFDSDWLVQRVAATIPDASLEYVKGTAQRLYARQAEGEDLPIFGQQMANRELRRQKVREILAEAERAELVVPVAPQAAGEERRAAPTRLGRSVRSVARGAIGEDCLTLPGLC